MASHHVAQKEETEKVPSAGKVMGNVFWDSDGYILVYFLEKGETIYAARYVQTLNKLRRALREKRPKKKTVILQHDNARPHTARLTLQTIQKKG
jgi:histone-lysine N-methyltransferase SETMAR